MQIFETSAMGAILAVPLKEPGSQSVVNGKTK